MKKSKTNSVEVLWWLEILISVAVLVLTIPLILGKLLDNTFSPSELNDWFILALTIGAFLYILVGIASLGSHRLWRQFHYLVTALIFLLSVGLFSRMQALGIEIQAGYFLPLLVSILITASLVLRIFKMPDPKEWQSILVVDDDDTLIKMIRPILMKENFSVLTANSGETGIEVAQIQKPNLIILDVILPGIKGRDVCKTLKENPETKDIPVIFLTAKDSEDDIKAEMEVGAEKHLTKPFEPKELISAIRSVLTP